MLSLSRKAEYAVAAMAHLARQGSSLARAREIGAALNLPLPVLMNIMKSLNRYGLVRATRGPKGGYELVRGPAQITLAHMVEAVEGPVRLTRCCAQPDYAEESACKLEPGCRVKGSLRKVHLELKEVLNGVTLAQIVADEMAVVAGDPG